jgi:hypothetical protein
VVLAESEHTALAFWQAGQPEEAYTIWKSALIESMYLGACPGNFQQLSYYDAIRGELYRDFADPIGMAARSLVEGLFGIMPDALHDTLTIQPGLPSAWKYASLHVPDIDIGYKQTGNTDHYTILPLFSKPLQLKLRLRARFDAVAGITVNGKKVNWKADETVVGMPIVQVLLPPQQSYDIAITWQGASFEKLAVHDHYAPNDPIRIHGSATLITDVYDPQDALKDIARTPADLIAIVRAAGGSKTFFVKTRQGAFTWWQPVSFSATATVAGTAGQQPQKAIRSGQYEKIDLTPYFNDKVTQIFKQAYLSPRPAAPTLQLPTQGIGNWCYPLTQANIDDAGLRHAAGEQNEIILPQGIPLATPGSADAKNILFTSQWHNYPDSVSIPLTGKASHLYLLMAGSTNAMQSQMDNGIITIVYTNGATTVLPLRNPNNWWPIEQDYYTDGYAFTTGAPKPIRIALKSGAVMGDNQKYATIKGFTNRAIDGGAATVLDIALNPSVPLQFLTLKTLTNDVVIGLMSITLIRL